MSYSVGVIICGAGKGLRAGFNGNKLLAPFEGSCALKKTLDAFDFPSISQMVVTSSQNDYEEICKLCSAYQNTTVVIGGETRMQSVANGLKQISTDIVLIHDGARPFIRRETVEECIQSVMAFGSGICAIDCTDTVAETENGKIVNVPCRESLKAIQTPQGFFTENIRYAYSRALENKESFTDDSSIFAKYCGKPTLCKGSLDNKKLTYAQDFTPTDYRCGFGIDTHAFGKPQDYILLGGVKIPAKSGLIAHSDGDVLIHALMDALLSACGLKDIGHYFPDTDKRFENANSIGLLQEVLALIKKENYKVKNLSIAIQAEKPKLANYIDDIKNSLAGILEISPTCIGVSAGTNEGLGYVGEGKGITVNAYVLLQSVTL